VGEIEQVPSSVSAIKIDGRRAYERVRAGEEVELAARAVRIEAIDVSAIRRDASGTIDVDIAGRCSSGTYIRAIARDLGTALGIGGHLTVLRRTAVGTFGLDAAHTLDELSDKLTVVPIADAARTSFPSVDLPVELAADVRHGRRLELRLEGDQPHALFDPDGEFLALYEPAGDQARAVAVFV